jgi:hypothetical protein
MLGMVCVETDATDYFREIALACHNPIFTPRIFSGVGTQNEAAQAEPA